MVNLYFFIFLSYCIVVCFNNLYEGCLKGEVFMVVFDVRLRI